MKFKKTLMAVVLGTGLLAVPAFADNIATKYQTWKGELPEINPSKVIGSEYEFGTVLCIGYDTDGDNHEDTRFFYATGDKDSGGKWMKLIALAIDSNGNGRYENDETYNVELQ